MPFYDLSCPECEREFNILASVADKTEKRIPCPECGSLDLQTVYKGGPAYVKSMGDAPPACPNRQICGSAGCRHA